MFLPLTDNMSLSKDLGTRHRAALGISEKSDGLAIVVSEETGAISIAENGSLARYLDIKTLEQILLDMYKPKDSKQSFITKWRRKMSKEIDNNLTLKIFAIIIAIILRSYVMSKENPPRTKPIRNVVVNFTNIESLEQQHLVIMDPKIAKINVELSGKANNLKSIDEKDILATVDLSGYKEGDVKVPVYVEVPSDVKLVDYSPKEILFKFEK